MKNLTQHASLLGVFLYMSLLHVDLICAHIEPPSHRIQTLDPDGTYQFSYNTGASHHKSFRSESRNIHGRISGSYGYIDTEGLLRITEYVADQHGYRATIGTFHPVKLPPADPLIIGPVPKRFEAHSVPDKNTDTIHVPAPLFLSQRISQPENPQAGSPVGNQHRSHGIDREQLLPPNPLLLIGPIPGHLQSKITFKSRSDTGNFGRDVRGSVSKYVKYSTSSPNAPTKKERKSKLIDNISLALEESHHESLRKIIITSLTKDHPAESDQRTLKGNVQCSNLHKSVKDLPIPYDSSGVSTTFTDSQQFRESHNGDADLISQYLVPPQTEKEKMVSKIKPNLSKSFTSFAVGRHS